MKPLNLFGVLRMGVAYLFNIYVTELLIVLMVMTKMQGYVQQVCSYQKLYRLANIMVIWVVKFSSEGFRIS